MTIKRTRLGCQVTTRFGKTPERGLPVEHVTLECTQPMLVLVVDKPGTDIYDARPIQQWANRRRDFR
jgi:hypothetical protein